MKKIIVFVLALVMCAVIFAGCGGTKENSRFVIVDSDIKAENLSNTALYVDKQTGIVYWYTHSGYGQTMTVLLNSDGTPVLYDFEKEKIIERDK